MCLKENKKMDLSYEDLFNFEESPEFDTGIEQTVVHDDALTFDWYSYNQIKEIIRSVEETDELIESEELFEIDDNEIEIFNTEFDVQLLSDIENSTRFTNCAIIDNEISNKSTIIQRCNNVGVRSVNQLSGTWEVDSQVVKDLDKDISRLGICMRHYNYDLKYLHPGVRNKISTEESMIASHCCLFCNKIKCFFTRGKTCLLHTQKVCGRIIQVPCRGLYNCPAITNYKGLSTKLLDNNKPRFICTNCFITNGGHLHVRPGIKKPIVTCTERGEHNTDTTLALKLFNKWIEQIAKSSNNILKVHLLNELVKLLNIITNILELKDNAIPSKSIAPSLFLIKIAFAIKKIDINEKKQAVQLKPTTCKDFGKILAHSVLQE